MLLQLLQRQSQCRVLRLRVLRLRALRRRPRRRLRFDLLFRLHGPLLRPRLHQARLGARLQVRLRRSGRRQELLRHVLGKGLVKESDQGRAGNRRRCDLRRQLRARLAQLHGLRHRCVRQCPQAGIADPFRAQDQTVSGRADRVRVNRCVRCREAKAGVRILRGPVDPADRVAGLQGSQDPLNNGAAPCRLARVQDPAHRGVPGCCRRYRRIKRLQRRSRASRSTRESQRSGSGRRWTSERLRVSESCTRRGNVQERGEQQRR